MTSLLPIVLFMILGLVLLFGSHYLLYISLVHFFSITSIFHKNTLLGVLFFLAASYILVSFFAHWKENYYTRVFYFLSGFWLGFFVNILLVTAAIWIIIGLTKLIGTSVNLTVIGALFFSLAFLYSIYGVSKATLPKIKNLSVTIPNLPTNWKGKKIVQLSDIHLGHIYREKFLETIVEKVNSTNPEMVLITGDLFDGMDGNLADPVRPLNNLGAPKGTYFVTGNHETYLGLDKAFLAIETTSIKHLHDQVVDIDGLKIIGIDYPSRNETKDVPLVLKSMEKYFSGKPNIFLYHSPTFIEQAKKSGVNLQLSGHTHRGQIFPFRYITRLAFKGYDYGLKQIGDYTIYTSSGVGTWGPTMRTGTDSEIVVITLQ